MSLNKRFKRKPLRPVLALLALAALVAVVALGASGSPTSANMLGYLAGPPAPAGVGSAQSKVPDLNDGFNQLPPNQRGLSYSTLAHMGLESSQRANIKVEEYESGHMMYLHGPSLAKLKKDVAGFFRETLGR